MNEILNISGNIECTKNADHILETAGLGEFFGYCFRNHTCKRRLKTECHQ